MAVRSFSSYESPTSSFDRAANSGLRLAECSPAAPTGRFERTCGPLARLSDALPWVRLAQSAASVVGAPSVCGGRPRCHWPSQCLRTSRHHDHRCLARLRSRISANVPPGRGLAWARSTDSSHHARLRNARHANAYPDRCAGLPPRPALRCRLRPRVGRSNRCLAY